ncbi:MAG: TRAP transporter large permease [Proteobacteria bacterium]|nr:TRAP transporter large permease [Pseudomonadota bacterium]MDA1324949.1 TRAP transporter large permease [Pseudomonadota bacterium]
MSNLELGVALFGAMMFLIVIRMPIAISMLLCGLGGFALIAGWEPMIGLLSEAPFSRVANNELTVIPLFVLMGQFASEGGISRELYRSARAWFGHYRGGIAMATIGGCAAFGAICGSSVATGATMATVAMPEMRRYGYSGALSTGVLAAGGTLGILIPPSIILVIYAILTEQSLAHLFLAAIIPGLIATAGYAIAVWLYVRVRPESGPAGDPIPMRDRFRSLRTVWPVAVIFGVVIGGIYLGVFTPTEGAAVGAAATGVLSWTAGHMRLKGIGDALLETAKITGMIYMVLIGAEFYSAFLALSLLPQALSGWIGGLGWAPMQILLVIVLVYLVLGCVMDGLAMILLTVPVFLPVVVGLDFGMPAEAVPIWFGILILIVVEVGLITPPIGINVYVINSMAPDVPMMESFKGIVPFFLSDVVRIAIILLFPATTTWLAGVG